MAQDEPLIELPNIPESTNPSLVGERSPLRAEAISRGGFEVDGLIPPGLEGLLMWIGPNPLVVDDVAKYTPAKGDGMVHSLSIIDASPRELSSRFIVTRSLVDRLGARPPRGPLRAGSPLANERLVHLAGRIIALDGAGLGYRITTDLLTACVEDFDTMLTSPMGRQVVVDPETGASAFLGLDPDGPPYVRLHQVNKRGVVTETTALPIGATGAEPGFGATSRTIGIVESSLLAHVPQGEDDVRSEITFDPERRPAVGLLPRGHDGSSTVWSSSEPGHVETVTSMRDTEAGADLVVVRATPERSGDPSWRPLGRCGTLQRLEVDAFRKRVAITPLDDVEIDGAATDASARMEDRRHAYAVTPDGSMVIAYNTSSGVAQRRQLPEHLIADRPMFVRDPDGHNDEEGWIIVPCFDRITSSTVLLIIDGTRFLGLPQSVISLPHRLPMSLTGMGLPAHAYR